MISRNSLKSGFGNTSANNKRSHSSFTHYDEEIDVDEMGAETEAEKHLKILLQKQLNTKLTVKDQFAQHRTFSHPSTYTAPTQLIQGACTLEKFKKIEEKEDLHQELQRCGLDENEITDYLLHKNGTIKGKYKVDPDMWTNYISAIEEKIKTHNEELLKPQNFRNVRKLTRHEMEIEKSLYAGCPEKSKLSTLVTILEEKHSTEVDSAFSHIKSIAEKLVKSKRKKSKSIGNVKQSLLKAIDAEEQNFQYDSSIHHAIVPLDEEEVKEKRLSIAEIKQIPRFENYKIGIPTKTLYVKNINPKTTVHELRALFGAFEEENKLPIDYRICTGRMKGQAFVKFPDIETAEKALKYANGYSLRGRPMIIEFGHQK